MFDKIFDLMEKSFPKGEFRSYENQKKLLGNPKYKLTIKSDENGNLIAFIAWWDLKGFNFIEHFAVSPLTRGQGIGSKMLREFLQKSDSPVILEVELPENEISERRIKFYERNGFSLNKFEYYQKPLRKNSSPVKMLLMSYPKEIKNMEFENIKNEIYKNVYGEI